MGWRIHSLTVRFVAEIPVVNLDRWDFLFLEFEWL